MIDKNLKVWQDASGHWWPVSDKCDLSNPDWPASLQRIVNFLEGDHQTKFDFVYLDDVHGNYHRALCGCEMHLAFHHHDAQAGKPHPVHVHRSKRHCEHHRHIEPHSQQHFHECRDFGQKICAARDAMDGLAEFARAHAIRFD